MRQVCFSYSALGPKAQEACTDRVGLLAQGTLLVSKLHGYQDGGSQVQESSMTQGPSQPPAQPCPHSHLRGLELQERGACCLEGPVSLLFNLLGKALLPRGTLVGKPRSFGTTPPKVGGG